MTRLRFRVYYVWAVLGLLIATATGWLLALVHFPLIEGVAVGFLFGLWFAWASPWLVRRLWRGLR